MRRADRLFQIIQILRGTARPITARRIADELEVSPRSVYRDIADLMAQRVPIRGEAGLGYVLDSDFDMPPLMLTPDELEAAALGAQWVASRNDPVLAAAARDLIAKISAVAPERLRPFLSEPTVTSPPSLVEVADGLDISRARAWIRAGRKIRLTYRDEAARDSERVVWPAVIGFSETVRLLGAWCELRQDFRNFRTDRILAAVFLDERHKLKPAELAARWKRHMDAGRASMLRKEGALPAK
jgi:predicted DNA-binding transcriptional regulator YafY